MGNKLETIRALQAEINLYQENKPHTKYPEIFDEIINTLKEEQAELINQI